MEILVTDLVNSCDYKLTYFLKLLTKHNITNHKLLTKEDLIKLRNEVKVVGTRSYSLRLAINKILNVDSIKVKV